MKRLMKILLGLSIGAAAAVLFAPKSGRELRKQLMGGATGKLLPAASVELPEPEGERLWDAGTATAVAEPPVVEPTIAEAVLAEEVVVIDDAGVVAEVTDEDVAVAEPEPAAEATTGDLRARIEETRAAVETDIAQPFAPVVAEAVIEEPADEEVAAEEAAEQVAADQVAADEEAVVEEPVMEGPVYQAPGPAVQPDVVVEAPPEEPRAWEIPYEEQETPVVEEPPFEEPVAEEPVAEQSPVSEAAEGLVADITVDPAAAPVEEASEEGPVAEEPATREGGSIDQAEMRRRIEETRARLKAKAFDAMMSGESALLSRGSGDKPVPKGNDVKLDGELESTIDESLSQEEY